MSLSKSKMLVVKRFPIIEDYFEHKTFVRGKPYCPVCKQKFEALCHYETHRRRDDCMPNPYSKPSMTLMNLTEESLFMICDYLNLQELVEFILAYPHLCDMHGMFKLWSDRMNRFHPRFCAWKIFTPWNWVFRRCEILQKIDFYIYGCQQGKYKWSSDEVALYREMHVRGSITSRNRHTMIYKLSVNGDNMIWNLF